MSTSSKLLRIAAEIESISTRVASDWTSGDPYVYHGTSFESWLGDIQTHGLRVNHGTMRGQSLGPGVYFALTSSRAAQYANSSYPVVALLRVKKSELMRLTDDIQVEKHGDSIMCPVDVPASMIELVR